jgi:hypothetical protein
LEFSRLESGEIRCRGAFEALLAVDGGVDLVIHKYKPILRRLASEAVTERVHAGAVAAFFRFRRCWVAAVGVDLFFGMS